MNNLRKPPIIWIKSSDEFERVCSRWLEQFSTENKQAEINALAIDTEFERRTSYFPNFALLQIFDGKEVFVIDTLEVGCPKSFKQICGDGSITKVMHACKEDLEVLNYSWGCSIQGLFDTQVAYAFVSGESSIGYAALVEKCCGVLLDKEENQSDWLARPLSEKQIEYAANDVLYLYSLFGHLEPEIHSLKSRELFETECIELCKQANNQPNFDKDYRQAKDVNRLNGKQLALFKTLYRWREETAINQNRTRNHIIRDHQLVEVARVRPDSKARLKSIEGIHPRSIRKYSEDILQIIEAHPEKPEQFEKPVINPRDIKQLKPLINQLAKIVEQKAKELEVNPGLIASKRIIKKIALAWIT
ncbi:MAG: HRDC domain-containing protein, partial [Kangiellaceae bacterium]|nr:HRDC domain-containing protein [Kangiellaceae bacterium]